MDRKKKSVTIVGRKERTLPTPVKIPSIMREWIGALRPIAVRPRSAASVTELMPNSSQSLNAAPITSKVSQKKVKIVSRKIGIANYLWVR